MLIVRTKTKDYSDSIFFKGAMLYWLNKTTDCSQIDDFTWLLAAFPIMRFLEAKDTQALEGRQTKKNAWLQLK